MKKKITILLSAVALLGTMATASERIPADVNGDGKVNTADVVEVYNFILNMRTASSVAISDFPAMGWIDDETIGTPDAGKTAWEAGDVVTLSLESPAFGNKSYALTYDGNQWNTDIELDFTYLANEDYTVSAVYAPTCVAGTVEYLVSECNIDEDKININFKQGEYSRLRIACQAGLTLTVATTGFTPAGATEEATEAYTLTTDENGNAFLYGIFAEAATMIVKYNDTTLAEHTFEAASEAGKSYVLYVRPSFSVSANQKVLFAPGNLQYNQTTNTWFFAANQWDMIGTDNVTGGTVSSDPTLGDIKEGTALADVIDLFGWSTSATNFGVSTSTDYQNDYSGDFVDWGTNQIGADAPNTWRTLTYEEWDYLLNTRTNASSLFGVAQVNGVNGSVFLPDNWICPEGVTFKSGFSSDHSVEAYGQYQTFTAEQWSKLESAGAVFLPAAGDRWGTAVNYVQESCSYWSATSEFRDVSCLYFFSDQAIMEKQRRPTSQSVRLVKDL